MSSPQEIAVGLRGLIAPADTHNRLLNPFARWPDSVDVMRWFACTGLLILFSFAVTERAHGIIEQTSPTGHVHNQYYADFDSANTACLAFAASFGSIGCPGSLNPAPHKSAGNFNDGSETHFGIFWYDITCPAGYKLDVQKRCVQVFNPKNNGQNPTQECRSALTKFPINIGTGNKIISEVVVRAGDLTLALHYNAAASLSQNGLGSAWSHSYGARIEPIQLDEGFFAQAFRQSGTMLLFFQVGSDWLPDADIYDKLEQLDDGMGTVTGWRFTATDNTVEEYDVNGRWQSATDIRGNTTTLTYDVQDRLSTVVTNTGDSLTFGYDALDRIVSVTDHASRTWGFRYDADNNLEFIDHPDATTRQFHYNEPALTGGADLPNALTGITDERGIRYATHEYDSEGRATASYHGPQTAVLTDRIDGVSVVYNPDESRDVTSSRANATNYATTTQIEQALVTDITGPGCAACGLGNTGSVFDPINNNLLSRTVDGVTTEWGDYDNRGNAGFQIEAKNTTEERRSEFIYDPRYQRRVTHTIEPSIYTHPTPSLVFGTDTAGNRTFVSAVGYRVTENTYDSFGNTLSTTISGYKSDGTAVSRTTAFQYNGPLNQLSQIDGPRTDVSDITTFEYYPDDVAEGNNRALLKRVTRPTGIV